jgi:septum site-determining protein MinD
MGEAIALLSGTGGLGKTALTAGLALALAKGGKKVLCVDCQAGLGTLDIYLGMEQQDALSYADVCRGDYPLSRAAVHPQFPCLHFLSAPVRVVPNEPEEDAFQAMVEQGRKQYDFVFLNTSAGLSPLSFGAAEAADRCICLCGMDAASIRTAGRVADKLQLLGKHDCRLVVSRVQPSLMRSIKLTVDDVIDRVGLPLLGLVPEDEQLLLLTAAGKFHTGKKWAFAAYDRISKRMQGQPVPVPTR